jgi:hypothetical protein
MSINLLKKLASSAVQPETVRPTQRKPPQRVRTVDALPDQAAQLSGSRIPECLPQNGAEKMLIPATWNEVIADPRVWAEIRPLIVDED